MKFIRKLKKTIILFHFVFLSTLLMSCRNENRKEDHKIKKTEENVNPSISNFLFFKKEMTYNETIKELKLRKISVNENPDAQDFRFLWPSKKDFDLLGDDCKVKMIQCFSLKVLDNEIPYALLYFVNNSLVRLCYCSEDFVINSSKSLNNLKLLRELFCGLREKYSNPHFNNKKGKIDTTIISEPDKGSNWGGRTDFYYHDNCTWFSNENSISIELNYWESKKLPTYSDYSSSSTEEFTSTEIEVIFDQINFRKVCSRFKSKIENKVKAENDTKVKAKEKKLREL